MRLPIQILSSLHRWIGLAVGLMAIVWFLSAFVMMYAGGMPRITAQSRLDHLPVLDFAAVRIGPAEAATRLGLDPENAGPPVLYTLGNRPAWRFVDAPPVYADDGAEFVPLSLEQATQTAARFLGEPAPGLRHVGTVESPDQWTLTMRRAMPLEKFAANDTRGTELYVSRVTGEVVQATTRRERTLAWLGTIPHWLYFDGLRQNQPLWYRLVVTLSAAVCVLAVLGMILAVIRWQRSKPFSLKRSIPFRGGMRWHYIAGGLFGVLIFTWAFSGLASMEPWKWMNVPELELPRDTFTGGEVELAQYEITGLAGLTTLAAPRHIKEATLQRIQGEHYWTLRTSAHEHAGSLPRERLHAPYDTGRRGGENRMLVRASTRERHEGLFDERRILELVHKSLPDIPVDAVQRLDDYDDYYYSRSRQAALPVLRIKLDDPLRTWLYVDLHSGTLVGNVHRYSRVERWIYNGLHSLDFRFWHSKRPLWDLGMIVLLAGGLATSVLGVWIGIRRLLVRGNHGN